MKKNVIHMAIWFILGRLLFGCSSKSSGPEVSLEKDALLEYAGAYEWNGKGMLYLQIWNELTAEDQLVAFDESGEVRTMYPAERDHFFTGAGVAVRSPLESRVEFHRDGMGKIVSLTWMREGEPPLVARRSDTETSEGVSFSNGVIQLAGTVIIPKSQAKHPAIILVHGSGPADRNWMLPFAHFLLRDGIAILSYDKRGVGGSGGDWKTASFEDLAGDVIAAFQYLKKRNDIDAEQIGLLGVSQAGWIMPLAAMRLKDLAFMISVSGAGIPGVQTTIDHAQKEMKAAGMSAGVIEQIIALMKLQYEYARTGKGWQAYFAAREKLSRKLGSPPETFPGKQDDPYWDTIRRLYFFDPAPVIQELQLPILALFGELDNNILPEKNLIAWEAALKAGGNPDYTLRILPKANHLQLEAKLGTNAEMASLRRFVPQYHKTIREWLARRIEGFGESNY